MRSLPLGALDAGCPAEANQPGDDSILIASTR